MTESGERFSSKWTGQKLKEHYQDFVYVVSEPDISTKVFFCDMADSTLSDAWYKERKDKIQGDNLIVISAAAGLLLNKMQCTSFEVELNPKIK